MRPEKGRSEDYSELVEPYLTACSIAKNLVAYSLEIIKNRLFEVASFDCLDCFPRLELPDASH